MRIFLAGIIQGSHVEHSIHDQNWRHAVTKALAAHLGDAQVYDHFQQHPQSLAYELDQAQDTFEAGLAAAAACDLLIAYLPEASMGTAIEMHEARRNGAVVLTVSPLAANWVVRLYSDRIFPDIAALEAFLASGQARRLLAEHSGDASAPTAS